MLTSKNAALCRRNRRLARQKWGLEGNHPLLDALNQHASPAEDAR